jgi:ribosomal protein S8E
VVKEAVDALGTVANESAKFYEKQGLFGEEAWKRRKSDADKPPAPQPVPPAQKVEVEITVKGDKEAVKQIKQVVRETTGGMRK